MTTVLICDDSNMARKQLARSLPADWNIEINFAKDGADCLKLIQEQAPDLLFLDLNMPEMDGYDVLGELKTQGLSIQTIVVSGDIQPEAQKRVLALGAIAFIKKPADREEVSSLLIQHGFIEKACDDERAVNFEVDLRDGLREIANVAVGQAADLLARMFDVFVLMPIPVINMMELAELQMALQETRGDDEISAVCQGFIGDGIAGEAMLLFGESSYDDIYKLSNFYKGELNDKLRLELLMDVSNIVISACLTGIANQLDIKFSQGHPIVLGQHLKMDELLKPSTHSWKKTLAIEICLNVENHNVKCELLLLFAENSIKNLAKRISFLS